MLNNLWGVLTGALLATPRDNIGEVIGLYRHAIKGLSADALEQVILKSPGETFPDDRRFALLKEERTPKFDKEHPEWLHKDNFLCAFTAPKLLAKFEIAYQLKNSGEASYALPCDEVGESDSAETNRLLTVRDRVSGKSLLGPIDLSQQEGCKDLGDFFSIQSGENVVCVAATIDNQQKHNHQFGNTSSGWKQLQDTRTLHIVNAATVRDLSKKIGVPLNPTRFRPNIVIDGPKAWSEFDWIGGDSIWFGGMKLKVIQKTVRCEGVSIDPVDPENVLDIPASLSKHFPEYGPYLGVYAVVEQAGTLSVGDNVRIL